MATKFFRYPYALKKRTSTGIGLQSDALRQTNTCTWHGREVFRYQYALKKANVYRDRSSKR